MIIKISKTGKAPPTKIGLHACYINLYLHDYFEPILFLNPPRVFKKARTSLMGVAYPDIASRSWHEMNVCQFGGCGLFGIKKTDCEN